MLPPGRQQHYAPPLISLISLKHFFKYTPSLSTISFDDNIKLARSGPSMLEHVDVGLPHIAQCKQACCYQRHRPRQRGEPVCELIFNFF
jgi:hypothetical protein